MLAKIFLKVWIIHNADAWPLSCYNFIWFLHERKKNSGLCMICWSHSFAFILQLNACIGSAVAAMGPKNVLEILQIRSICAQNEWILPILEKYIVGASLQFFLKDILGMVKAIEKSITKVLRFLWNPVLYKSTSVLNCSLTMLRMHQLNSSWRMTSFSPPRELKVMCILCGLCCHLVATIHVILQVTSEF